MKSGRDTLLEIEQSIKDVRAQERRAQVELEEINAQRAELLGQRTSAFRELAEVRAESALADGVIDRADNLSHRVATLLKARQTTVENLKARYGEAQTKHDELTARSEPLRLEISAVEDELDGVASQAHKVLAGENQYVLLRKKLEDLEGMRDKAREKAEQSRADRERKGRDYENDVLFMYLWRRKYRSEGYHAHPIIRWADDWVAALVDYNNARANYAVLLEIPDRLYEHVEHLESELGQQLALSEDMEAEKIRELAGTDLTGRLSQVRLRQREHNDALEEVGAEMAEISAQLNRYAEGLDPSFRAAVTMSAEFLEHSSFERLVRLARDTVEPSDDQIVARISEIDAKVERLRRDISKQRSGLEDLARRREELIRVAADFRRSNFDQPGSVFAPDDDLGMILEELVRGVITGGEYWSRARRRHRWNSRPADPFRRRSGFPPFGGGDFGGTWSGGGDFRSDGGF